MTKEQLANKLSSEVRNNATLFSLFKTYLLEDLGYIPSGCFGCEFNTHFKRWSRNYKENKIEIIKQKKQNNMNVYRLKNENFKTFYKGEVLSINSTDEQWADFIFNIEREIENRKALFLVLPPEISTQEEKVKEIEVVDAIEEKKSDDLQPAAVADLSKKNKAKR